MMNSSESLETLSREQLLIKAGAILELRSRRNTVYGIVCPDKGLIKSLTRDDSGEFVETDIKPDIQIAKKMEPFLTKKKRFKVVFGGRGSTKSVAFGSISAGEANDRGLKFGCFREYQSSIEDSVHSLIAAQIKQLNYSKFDVTDKKITHSKHGETHKFRGLARNVDSVQSMHGFDRFWIEEAQATSKKSIEKITPTLRESDSEIWFSMNPQSSADPMAERFIMPFIHQLDEHGYYEDDLHLIIKINYMDNPWFPEVLEQERLFDLEHLQRAEYDWKWLGAFNDSVENAIITAEIFDACVDAHKIEHLKTVFKPHGAKKLAHDPSGTGDDPKGLAVMHGSIVTHVEQKLDGDIDDGCDWATAKAIDLNVDQFICDGDGMGAGLKRQISSAFEGKNVTYHMFRGGLSGIGQDRAKEIYLRDDTEEIDPNPKTYAETFRNNRAQYYIGELARRCYNTYKCVVKGEYIDPDDMISFDSEGIENMASFKSELCRIPKKANGQNLHQVMSKEEMKKLGIKSPNMADSVMMLMGKKVAYVEEEIFIVKTRNNW